MVRIVIVVLFVVFVFHFGQLLLHEFGFLFFFGHITVSQQVVDLVGLLGVAHVVYHVVDLQVQFAFLVGLVLLDAVDAARRQVVLHVAVVLIFANELNSLHESQFHVVAGCIFDVLHQPIVYFAFNYLVIVFGHVVVADFVGVFRGV